MTEALRVLPEGLAVWRKLLLQGEFSPPPPSGNQEALGYP